MSRSLCFNTQQEQICLQVTPLAQDVLQSQVPPIGIDRALLNVATPAERDLILSLISQYGQAAQQGIENVAIRQQINALIDVLLQR